MPDLENRPDSAPQNIPLPPGGYKPVWKFKESLKARAKIPSWALVAAMVLALALAAGAAALFLLHLHP